MTIAELQREVDLLEGRLRDGERKIAEAAAQGAYVKRWEDYWLELLHTYEAACRRLQAAERARQEGRAA